MKPNRRVLYALVLAVASGLGACEQSDEVGQLTGPVIEQQFSKNNGHGKKTVEILKRTNPLTGDVTYITSDPVTEKGAVLQFGSHTLVVPKNAIREKTYFAATLRAGDEIRLDMRAWDMRGREVTTFKKQVELTIDFSDAAGLVEEDMKYISVFYLNPNGDKERVKSKVDEDGRKVTGFLDHFSDYIPGTLRNDTTVVFP